MSKFNENGIIFQSMEEMMTGYQEMGILNISLSEEGLDQDSKDLESYEKYLVESE
jgi:hypothetical protein